MASTILISGASGLIGSALVPALERAGHRVRRLVRRDASSGTEVSWNPAHREMNSGALEDVDVVINLTGETVGQRWTSARRRRIRASRVDATGTLVAAIGKAKRKPATLINASAVGYYGDRGDTLLDEQESPGHGFLAEVCQQWERAAAVAAEPGTRVVRMRTGLVLAKEGGALQRMLPPFRAGIGGRLGDGQQWMSWIALPDLVRAIIWTIDHAAIVGPVNMCVPNPVRNEEFTRALGLELHRPTIVPVPAFALRAIFGQMALETLLASQRATPSVLLASGFAFETPTISQALAQVL
jgi:uncharacterized protein (TIGR01777 family)